MQKLIFVPDEAKRLAELIRKGLAIDAVRENKPLPRGIKLGDDDWEDELFERIRPLPQLDGKVFKGDALAVALVGFYENAETAYKIFDAQFQERTYDPIGVAAHILGITRHLANDVALKHEEGLRADEIARFLNEGAMLR